MNARALLITLGYLNVFAMTAVGLATSRTFPLPLFCLLGVILGFSAGAVDQVDVTRARARSRDERIAFAVLFLACHGLVDALVVAWVYR